MIRRPPRPATFVIAPSATAGRRWVIANGLDPARAFVVTDAAQLADHPYDQEARVDHLPGMTWGLQLGGRS